MNPSFRIREKLDEQFPLAGIETVRLGFRIEDPVFIHAMLLIRGELGPDITIRRARR